MASLKFGGLLETNDYNPPNKLGVCTLLSGAGDSGSLDWRFFPV